MERNNINDRGTNLKSTSFKRWNCTANRETDVGYVVFIVIVITRLSLGRRMTLTTGRQILRALVSKDGTEPLTRTFMLVI